MFSNLFYFLRLLFAASPALVIGELAWGRADGAARPAGQRAGG